MAPRPPHEVALRGPVLRGARIVPQTLVVGDGAVLPGNAPRSRRLRLPEGWVIVPGLVDLQVNGFAGAEVGEDPEANAHVARELARAGVTAFCPTLVSRGPDGYRRAARGLAATAWPADGARPAGVHLEGPFLSPLRPGAHRPRALAHPAPERVEALVRLIEPRIVTLAPELPGAVDAIRRLVRGGVTVSLGHTEADAAAARAAFDAGARLVTHALNAMPGLTARGPGLLAAALRDRRVSVCVIADGVHVAPEPLAVLAAMARARLVAVSDAVAAAGAPPGPVLLGGRTVTSDGVRVTYARGRLAGSACALWTGPVTLEAAGVPRAPALGAACLAPRRALGVRGDPLAPGSPADLVVLDAEGRPRITLVGGRPCGPAPGDVLPPDRNRQ